MLYTNFFKNSIGYTFVKIPESPPSINDIFKALIQAKDEQKLLTIINSNYGISDEKGRYVHWEKLKHLPPPAHLTSEEYWYSIKSARQKVYKHLALKDELGQSFCFCIPDALQKSLHWLDQNAAGSITMNQPIANPHTRDTYLISSLIEESISSSQLEGASTTRNVAKEMLRQGRPPKDHSEQMIFNNYKAMAVIRDYKEDDLISTCTKQLLKTPWTTPTKQGSIVTRLTTFMLLTLANH